MIPWLLEYLLVEVEIGGRLPNRGSKLSHPFTLLSSDIVINVDVWKALSSDYVRRVSLRLSGSNH